MTHTQNWVMAPPAPSQDSRLIGAVKEYLSLLEAGQAPARDEFLARHPDLAAELGDCLAGLELVHSIGPALSGAGRELLANAEVRAAYLEGGHA